MTAATPRASCEMSLRLPSRASRALAVSAKEVRKKIFLSSFVFVFC